MLNCLPNCVHGTLPEHDTQNRPMTFLFQNTWPASTNSWKWRKSWPRHNSESDPDRTQCLHGASAE
uniref:Uncharacterized protein n=1 Tax=Anguilla anguilla TaxID=7936 RepID=A0A0E9Q2F4_ANGAN